MTSACLQRQHRLLLGLSIAFWLASCGSQADRAMLSNTSFDRCFDMDFNPDESPSVKSFCWREWLDTRYEAEPDDKVRYAEMRRAEIAQGFFVPGPPSTASTYSHRPRLFDTDVFNKRGAPDAGDVDTDALEDTETTPSSDDIAHAVSPSI